MYKYEWVLMRQIELVLVRLEPVHGCCLTVKVNKVASPGALGDE